MLLVVTTDAKLPFCKGSEGTNDQDLASYRDSFQSARIPNS